MGNLTRLITDSLLILLLLGLLVLPISSLGILKISPEPQDERVLSTQDVRINKGDYPTPTLKQDVVEEIEETILKESTSSTPSTTR